MPRESVPLKFSQGRNDTTLSESEVHDRFLDFRNDNPGPGSYRSSPSSKSPESFSKKGYGNFASQHRRWYDAPPSRFNPPGPSEYQIDHDTMNKKDYSRLNASSSFAPRKSRSIQPTRIEPGPGQYVTEGGHHWRHELSESHSTFGTSSRFNTNQQQRVTNTPGPGTYTSVEQKPNAHSPKRISPVFRKRTEPKKNSKIDMLISSAKEEENQVTPKKKKIIFRRAKSNPKSSSVFADSNLDRFGNPILKSVSKEETPGPGTYGTNNQSKKNHKHISSSFFVSGSERFRNIQPGAPGPAFYSSKEHPKQKKSFHYNLENKWV